MIKRKAKPVSIDLRGKSYRRKFSNQFCNLVYWRLHAAVANHEVYFFEDGEGEVVLSPHQVERLRNFLDRALIEIRDRRLAAKNLRTPELR